MGNSADSRYREPLQKLTQHADPLAAEHATWALTRLALLLLFAFLPLCSLLAEEPKLGKGFEHFYNLEYDDAIREFRGMVTAKPNDPAAHNALAQAILYREMFRAGALESEMVSGNNAFLRRAKVEATAEAARGFEVSINRAMELSQTALQSNPKDTLALYSLGNAHGLRANYNFLVRKAWMDALRDATAARRHHNQLVDVDPNFVDARLVQGAHDYLVGSLPLRYKMLGFLAGIRGDREKGMEALRLVAEKGVRNRYDAQVLLAVIYRREKKAEAAIPLLGNLVQRFPRNYLFRLEQAQMYSDFGKRSEALAALQKVEEMKKAGAAGFASLSLEKVYFYRANLLFWYHDFDAALDYMKRVTPKANEMDLNTSVLAWMRLGQIYDVKGRRGEAMEAYKKAIAAAPNSDAARESKGYLSSPYRQA